MSTTLTGLSGYDTTEYGIATAPNAPTVNNPVNASADTSFFRILNITVTDPDGDAMNVSVYGDNTTTAGNLLGFFQTVTNGTTTTYNWSSRTLGDVFGSDLNLNAYYKFDSSNDSNTLVIDSSTYNNNGTINASSFIVNCKFGKCLNHTFAASQYVQVADANPLDINGSFTISFWANFTPFTAGPNAAGVIISKHSNGASSTSSQLRGIRLEGGTQDRMFISEQNANRISVLASTFEGALHHFALTSNATNSILYIDGVSQGTYAGSLSQWFNGAHPLRIGASQAAFFGSGANSFNGTIDDVALFNRTLTQGEVRSLWNLTNGSHYWKADSNDGTTTTTTGTNQFLIGSLLTVTLNAPADASTMTSIPVDFNFTATAGTNSLSSCTLYHNASGTFSSNASTTSMVSGTNTNITVSFANGAYTWNVRCIDSGGFPAFATSNRTVTVSVAGGDSTPPAITYQGQTPDSATVQSSTSTTINVSVTDTTSNIDACLLEWSSVNETMTETGSGTTIQCTVTKSSLSTGNYSYKVYSNDTAGNMNVSATRTLSIDATNPTVTLNNPSAGFAQSSTSVTFNATVSDNNLQNVTLYIDGVSNETNTSRTNATYIFTKTIAVGSHNLSILAYDSLGNSNQSATRNFTIDATAPTTTPTGTKNDSSSYTFNTLTSSGYVSVALSCSDGSGAGCDKTLYCADGVNSCSPSTTYSSAVQVSTEGTSYFRYSSNDTAGNTETTESSTIKIDTTKPYWSANTTNATASTNTTSLVHYNITFTDETSAGYVIFSYDNGSGSFVDDSSTTWTSAGTISVNKTIVGTRGQTVRWKWTANDSVGNVNVTPTFSFVIANTAPTITTLQVPANDTITANNQTTFNWTDSTDADSDTITYTIHISNTTTFTTLQLANVSALSQFTPNSTQALPEGVWFWKVYSNDSYGQTASSTFNLTVNKSLAIAVSPSTTLSNAISWTVATIPSTKLSANGNNASLVTQYDIAISATGANVDLYMKADGDLLTSGGGSRLGLGNQTFTYNVTNSTVPGTAYRSITTSYADTLVASNIADGSLIYLKFYLDVPSAQNAGTYNNTVSFQAVATGDAPS